ncbi:MAG TPA: adenosine deaminase [Propioniciclava tarda]|nr:adenosine deaminase [Propioniciclava tarda]HQD60658.1 adenosine deaminase [Propioniciclava tarda]
MTNVQLIAALPKAELHVHIEGTLEPELKFDLAARNGVRLPYDSPQAVRDAYSFTDLTSFLVQYYDGMNVLLTEPDFYDLAMAYFTRAASDHVRWVELFFDPQAHTSRGVPFDIVIRGLRRAQLDAEATLGVRSALIMCFLRDFTPEFAMATLLESLPYRQWILGVGLDSDERDNPPARFAAVFARARQEGYFLTMHCDVDQADSIEHIRQALHEIGVQRLDHGTNIVESPDLVAEVGRRRIGLTCCPVSNTWVSESSKSHLIKQLLDAGVKVTINSDDPAYFNGYLNANLELVDAEQHLTRAELTQLVRNAFEVSWAPTSLRDEWLAEVDRIAADLS